MALMKNVVKQLLLPNLLFECSHRHVGEYFDRDTAGRRHVLYGHRQTAGQKAVHSVKPVHR